MQINASANALSSSPLGSGLPAVVSLGQHGYVSS